MNICTLTRALRILLDHRNARTWHGPTRSAIRMTIARLRVLKGMK